MLDLKKVAVTGGLSCGKSSACLFFKELGAYVISADEVVHKLLHPNTDLGKRIINLLGPDIIVDKQFDRSKISKRVFTNTQLLKSLESILHSPVYAEIEEQYRQARLKSDIPLFIAEIPLLFETGHENDYEVTIAIYADPERCLERFMRSTGCSKEEFMNRVAQQMSPEEKAEKADIVLINNGSSEELKAAVKKIFNKLKTH